MPQLDVFWWGLKFFFCWIFFICLYVYMSNLKFFLGGGFYFSYFSSSNVFNFWSW